MPENLITSGEEADHSEDSGQALEKRENSGYQINIAGDEVWSKTSELPENQRNAIRWYFGHIVEEEITLSEAAKRIGYDHTVVNRLFHGKYEGNINNVVQAIEKYHKLSDEPGNFCATELVMTSIMKKIWQCCEWALNTNSVVFIYGESQIGKTIALMEFARRHNHGQTKYIRMPCTAGVQLVMKEIAKACRLSQKNCFENTRKRVLNAIDPYTLFIADEIHQAFQTYHKQGRIMVLEMLREIHDRTNCGMVLCGTNTMRDEFAEGKEHKMLEQLNRRGIVKLQLPDYAPKKDLDAIAKVFGLQPATGEALELMMDINHENGLGKYHKFLKAASKLAFKRGEKMNWDHFITAHDIIKRLSEKSEKKQ